MRPTWPLLVLALLLPLGRAVGQGRNSALARLVRPAPGTRPLGVVLAELARQGRLPLSYSSSLVPVARPCHLPPGPPRPLGIVLRELLAAEHLSFGLLNGQLVLWPAHAAVPTGVVAVNGRTTPLPHATAFPTPARGKAAGAGKVVVADERPTQPPESGRPPASAPVIENRRASATNKARPTDRQLSAKRPAHSLSEDARATKPQAEVSLLSRSEARNRFPVSITKGPSTAKRNAPKARLETVESRELGTAERRARSLGNRPGVRVTARSVSTPAAQPISSTRTRAEGQSRSYSGTIRGSVAWLPVVPVSLKAVREPRSLPMVLAPTLIVTRAATAETNKSPQPGARKPVTLASLPRTSYLHAETWVSESLPLSAAAKVGVPRFYIALGIAAGPLGRQPGGAAWGVGLGTVGQARGRFTPSLDVMHWFLVGTSDPGPSQGRLTQVRPLLAWQLKQGGRWQLVGGPTLNLATAHGDGRRTRGGLGQNQWLWLDSSDKDGLYRLWPGVQLGLRF